MISCAAFAHGSVLPSPRIAGPVQLQLWSCRHGLAACRQFLSSKSIETRPRICSPFSSRRRRSWLGQVVVCNTARKREIPETSETCGRGYSKAVVASAEQTGDQSDGENALQPEDMENRGEIGVFTASKEQAGQRLDQAITKTFTGQSRSYFQALIDEQLVRINGVVAGSKSRKVVEGDKVEVEFVTPERDLPLTPENIPLDIVYEDEHFVIINKAAGMVVHPAPGNWTGTVVHALAYRYHNQLKLGGQRPGIVHRLDKGTSGLLIAARTASAHRQLTTLFAKRAIAKTYLAVTVGSPAGVGCRSAVLDAPIGRSRTDRTRMAVTPVDEGGRRARSIVQIIGEDTRRLLHLVQIRLETGRTHQIRVHLRHARAPVLGDPTYGALDVNKRYRSSAQRPMLHAWQLSFSHPFTGDPVDVFAKLPKDMSDFVQGICPKHSQQYPGLHISS